MRDFFLLPLYQCHHLRLCRKLPSIGRGSHFRLDQLHQCIWPSQRNLKFKRIVFKKNSALTWRKPQSQPPLKPHNHHIPERTPRANIFLMENRYKFDAEHLLIVTIKKNEEDTNTSCSSSGPTQKPTETVTPSGNIPKKYAKANYAQYSFSFHRWLLVDILYLEHSIDLTKRRKKTICKILSCRKQST